MMVIPNSNEIGINSKIAPKIAGDSNGIKMGGFIVNGVEGQLNYMLS